MAKLKYTKGEWEISRTELGITLFDSGDYAIGEMHWGLCIPDEQIKANAHLISASPDMYEAIENFIDATERTRKTSEVKFSVKQSLAYSTLKKALAKAEGK